MNDEDDDYHSYETLFLDRDGVINRRIVDDYVTSVEKFEFLPAVLDALKIFAKNFKNIIVVTNQQGIGKGLMDDSDVQEIHDFMVESIEEAGGRIDGIYYCGSLKEEEDERRKPGIGMALDAKRDFPDIDFSKSIMIGDTMSDMKFGKNAGMYTVLTVPDNYNDESDELIDEIHNGLYGFALELE